MNEGNSSLLFSIAWLIFNRHESLAKLFLIVYGTLIVLVTLNKDYLHYKTITSKNVSSEAHIKIFLFRRKTMFCSQDIQVFLFLTIPRFTKSVTSR